jgi:hypothetical protein
MAKAKKVKHNWGNSDVLIDALNTEKIVKKLRARSFSENLYSAMCNKIWVKEGLEYTLSWRTAGAVVAELRDLGEDYMAYYCGGKEGHVTEEVKLLMAEMGFTPREWEKDP